MLPVPDASSAFCQDRIGPRLDRPLGLERAIGVSLALASSLVLWEALVHVARWAAQALF